MSENFKFLKNPSSGKWVVIAPKRAKRPDVAKGVEPVCPFCTGNEKMTPSEVHRLGGGEKDTPGWEIRVVPNLYSFAPVHEIIIHSPAHTDGLFRTDQAHLEKLFQVYRQRYQTWRKKGNVVLFHNHGTGGGESLPHPHSQLAVIDFEVQLSTPRAAKPENIIAETTHFSSFIPGPSDWPYEVWFLPKKRGRVFGEISNPEISDLAATFKKILGKLQKSLGDDFSFNFYIYQGGDWYLRLVPRVKVIGGFEIGTNVLINTSDPEQVAKTLAAD